MNLRSLLYLVARLIGDYQAVKKGRGMKRLRRRIVGRMTGKALWKIFK